MGEVPTLRRGDFFMQKMKENSLYLVLSEECGRGRCALEVAKDAIAGGVDMIQMREKGRSHPELIRLGDQLCAICNEREISFIVNDDPALAWEIGADGVHLGQEDLLTYPLKDSRDILGPESIIGVSTHSLEQFGKANEEDFDYIAFGPIFPTKTKDYFIGTNDIAKVLKIAKRPVFFIGGINLDNVDGLLSCGAKNVALIRGISEADDIADAAKRFKEKITSKKGGCA